MNTKTDIVNSNSGDDTIVTYDLPIFIKIDEEMEKLETHKAGQCNPFLFEP